MKFKRHKRVFQLLILLLVVIITLWVSYLECNDMTLHATIM